MAKQRKNELVIGQFFEWKLFMRNGVYWADGRSNPRSAGRHSLGAKHREEARSNLRQLDVIKAIELGIADEAALAVDVKDQLTLADGVALYQANVQRPAITGGASPATWKRYRAVFDKAIPFWNGQGVRYWNQIRKAHLEGYAAWLDGEAYEYRTEFLELTTLKQCIKWLIEEGHLPAECRINLPLAKPSGTDTYSWRAQEVAAMVASCRQDQQLHWLANVLICLACTGMRISELAGLRWTDVDFEGNRIALRDETASRRRLTTRAIRQTKSRRSRSFPIHPELRPVFEGMVHNPDGSVFHGPKGGILSPDITRLTLIKSVIAPLAKLFPTEQGEIGFANGRLHSFRHYFCSMCANRNVPEQLLMEWLGHRESKMVRHYYHVHDAVEQEQMSRVNFTGGAAE